MYKQYITNKYRKEFNTKFTYLSNNCSFKITEELFRYYWHDEFYKYLFPYCLLIIKPECIAFGRNAKLIKLLKEYKFELVYYKYCLLSPLQVLSNWEYSWQNVTLEHIFINQKLLTHDKSIILILKNTTRTEISACEFLTDLKGSAIEEKRKDYQIRTKLAPLNTSINFIHTSDTIFDFVYELGIFFSYNDLKSIIEIIDHANPISFDTLLSQQYKHINLPSSDLCLENVIHKIEKVYPSKNEIVEKLLNIKMNKDIFDMDFILKLESESVFQWDWEWLLIISSYINYKVSPL